ncbi:MAG TPA: TRAM domain-containing protein, partial [Vicinamibacterales bacterium]
MTRLRAFGASARQARGQVIDVDIEAVAANGDGIASCNGRRLTVPFTIPGERVRVRVPEGQRARPSAVLLEILRASPHRVTPACRHFGPGAAPGL